MGWMFVPIVDYHGGGADAAFEPMSQHLPEYSMALAQYLLAGTAACYRGFRLFDTPVVAAVVAGWVSVYKQYRDIIALSDIIHVRRPNGQTLDAFMHANAMLPPGRACGFAAVFNPTSSALTETMSFPLYYTGISSRALVSLEGAAPVAYDVARDYSIRVSLTLAPRSVTWFAITNGDAAR
jgi:hypothetical protein